ncbi:excisionase family DNA-binding protein [Azohydromonas sp.]|uniref:excisionase family DNA-binding protein n=1 Tax=Azohydromonas sp. TaxID=1872666 RepID=UPI002CDB7343|nr:excisionase family DNA-binding protein [Azohydromonas sp.]HMM85337.1 excisionase family DNA-binding protein [Azohydromonas sp.]
MSHLATSEPLAHSPESAAKRLGVPLRLIYALLAAGELRSTKIGKRRLIPDVELQRLLQRKLTEAA